MPELRQSFDIRLTPVAAVKKALHEAGGLSHLVEFGNAANSGRQPCAGTVLLKPDCTPDQAAAVKEALKQLLAS